MNHLLDVRDLPPPEPFEQVLDAIAELPGDERLCVLHRRQPFPLYDLLRRLGYDWDTTGTEGQYRILIWRRDPVGADPFAPRQPL
ncbi:MAG: DUF2249 domain-containing protein [Sphingobacteriia bacterium]|nr:DUF2249 domain-containing protein [Sphingobacteriia bacterium]NCC41736.1 DUF2249 domain-containing protein [Gammaproteobacteria bacterium]